MVLELGVRSQELGKRSPFLPPLPNPLRLLHQHRNQPLPPNPLQLLRRPMRHG